MMEVNCSILTVVSLYGMRTLGYTAGGGKHSFIRKPFAIIRSEKLDN